MSDRDAADEFLYVDRHDQWRAAADRICSADVLAVDTEANSMHAYVEQVCLVQIATELDDAFVIDPLALDDLDDLAEPLAHPDVVTIFHGADFDVTSLRRDFGFEFAGIFDTMVAAQLLGDEKLSLRDLVERFFGVTLEKAHTRADWGKRPLTRDQIDYSYLDVKYLVELWRVQLERLEDADLLEEAEIEFERLALREPAERGFDPHGWARIKGAKELAPEEKAILVELYAVRDRLGQKLNRPVFKVLGNDTMLRIARARPSHRGQLTDIKGVSSFVVGRMGKDMVNAVARGLEQGEPAKPPPRRPDPRRRLDYGSQKRLGRIRDWRNVASEKSGVTTMAILPNYAMFEIARLRPDSLAELEQVPGVGRRRMEKWGDAILGLAL